MADDGLFTSTYDPRERLDTTDRPEAYTSGLGRRSDVTPPPENGATASSASDTVVRSAVAPAVMTYGSLPGDVTTPGVLPAAATTTMPALHTRSTAKSSGSTRYDWPGSNPSDRFTTRILYVDRCVTSHSSASSTIVTSVAPSRPAIFRETICAPGAIPLIAPDEAAPVPAMRPATKVPWP